MSILVVGALHHDVIVEAPSIPRIDETLPGKSVRYDFGGKGGNQAVQAARLGKAMGIPVAMIGCIGRDAPGQLMLQTLGEAGVDCTNVQQVDASTGMSVAISLPDGAYGAVIVSGSNHQLRYADVELPKQLTWLILQQELTESANITFAEVAKSAKAKVLLNAAPARPMNEALLKNVDVLVVNRVEAADMLGIDDTDVHNEATGQRLKARTGCDVILTLGGEGVIITDDAGHRRFAAHSVDVISTHGAGDAFVGALAVKLAGGAELNTAAEIANAAAALHVSMPVNQRGNITWSDIEALVQTSSR